MFLGVDGGGTKTAFVLIDNDANVVARHLESSAYYLETGLDATRAMLGRGIAATLASANVGPEQLRYAFFGLPAYGEDSRIQPQLDALPGEFLNSNQYRCDCDMICSWAGSLACEDGISVISGTGSMAYGEFAGQGVRVGGWGELFSDEGSAYWIAREGLNLFSKMSDGRVEQGPLYTILKRSFDLKQDLDLCGYIYNTLGAQRSAIAQISQLVSQAAAAGDVLARDIFARSAAELVAIVVAVRRALKVPDGVTLPVSYSGGVFDAQALLLAPFRHGLSQHPGQFSLMTPLLEPAVGAAIYAAKCAGVQFGRDAINRLSKA
jgi:N-acetylglucosamine kinase-like BadF-type ATPase